MKRKPIRILLLSALAASLSSCDIYAILDFGSKASTQSVSVEDSGEGYYKPSSVTPFTQRDINLTMNADVIPSTGHLKLLVLPIEFSDYPFSSSFRTDLDHALNGSAEDTGYWESLASYYEKSSFGKLDLDFVIAPNYSAGMSAKSASSKYGGTGDNGIALTSAALTSYKSSHSVTSFDSDSNGWVDGVIAVYSCNDYYTGSYSWDTNKFFWAYTYWATETPNADDPSLNLYFFLSYDFLYEATTSPKVDAHTLIHEFGHMLGLDDYYPDSDSDFNAAGGIDMEDLNICDHDAYSKMTLGWITPKVATDSTTVTLRPAESSGDCLLIPYDGWNGTAFDEYILLELYTPTGLNYLDSHARYSSRPLGYTVPGVKIYHIDSRVMKIHCDRSWNVKSKEYLSSADDFALSPTEYAYFEIGATNCQKDYAPADSTFSLIHLMEASGKNSFKNGSYGTNATLFKSGSTFRLSSFGSAFFPKKTTLNNGKAWNWSVSISNLASSSATVTVTKL